MSTDWLTLDICSLSAYQNAVCTQSKTGIWNSVGHRALQKRGTLLLINNFYFFLKRITLEGEPKNSLTTKQKTPQKPQILPFMALEACGSGAKRCTSNNISIKPLSQYRAIGLSSLSEPYKCSDLLALLHVCQCEKGLLPHTSPGPLEVYGVIEPQLSLLNRTNSPQSTS